MYPPASTYTLPTPYPQDLLARVHPARLAQEQTDPHAFGWFVRLCQWLMTLCGKKGLDFDRQVAELDAASTAGGPWRGFDHAISGSGNAWGGAAGQGRPGSAIGAAAAAAPAPPLQRPVSALASAVATAAAGADDAMPGDGRSKLGLGVLETEPPALTLRMQLAERLLQVSAALSCDAPLSPIADGQRFSPHPSACLIHPYPPHRRSPQVAAALDVADPCITPADVLRAGGWGASLVRGEEEEDHCFRSSCSPLLPRAAWKTPVSAATSSLPVALFVAPTHGPLPLPRPQLLFGLVERTLGTLNVRCRLPQHSSAGAGEGAGATGAEAGGEGGAGEVIVGVRARPRGTRKYTGRETRHFTAK